MVIHSTIINDIKNDQWQTNVRGPGQITEVSSEEKMIHDVVKQQRRFLPQYNGKGEKGGIKKKEKKSWIMELGNLNFPSACLPGIRYSHTRASWNTNQLKALINICIIECFTFVIWNTFYFINSESVCYLPLCELKIMHNLFSSTSLWNDIVPED